MTTGAAAVTAGVLLHPTARPASARPAAQAAATAPVVETAGLQKPPALRGTVLTLVGLPAGDATPDAAWAGKPVDPHDGALTVALTCRGDGVVTVQLTSGEAFRFACTAAGGTHVQVSDWVHPEPFTAAAVTEGRVAWSLAVAVRPVGDVQDRWHDLP